MARGIVTGRFCLPTSCSAGSASGGAATDVTKLDTSLEESFHAWPSFLPDGRHFLYLAWSAKPENRAVYISWLVDDQNTVDGGRFHGHLYSARIHVVRARRDPHDAAL